MIESERHDAGMDSMLDGDTSGNGAGGWAPPGVSGAAWGLVCVLAFLAGTMVLAAAAVAVFASNNW